MNQLSKIAFEDLREEHDKLYSLARALDHELCPPDPANAQNYEHLVAWRLAQMLRERLEETAFVNRIGRYLGVINEANEAVREVVQ